VNGTDPPRRRFAMSREHHELGSCRTDLAILESSLRDARRGHPGDIAFHHDARLRSDARNRTGELDIGGEMMAPVFFARFDVARLENDRVRPQQSEGSGAVAASERIPKSLHGCNGLAWRRRGSRPNLPTIVWGLGGYGLSGACARGCGAYREADGREHRENHVGPGAHRSSTAERECSSRPELGGLLMERVLARNQHPSTAPKGWRVSEHTRHHELRERQSSRRRAAHCDTHCGRLASRGFVGTRAWSSLPFERMLR
jgi:hypothetical protein